MSARSMGGPGEPGDRGDPGGRRDPGGGGEPEGALPHPAWTVEEAASSSLSPADLSEIRDLMDVAFGERFSEEDWAHAVGGRHFFIRSPEGSVVSHASVVGRTLEISGRTLSTGYVEAVATRPDLRGKGLATAIMRAVADHVDEHFRLGALSSGLVGFYERLGWIRWRGATWCRGEAGVFRTADEDGGVLVLPTRTGPPADVEGDIVVDWREGDVW